VIRKPGSPLLHGSHQPILLLLLWVEVIALRCRLKLRQRPLTNHQRIGPPVPDLSAAIRQIPHNQTLLLLLLLKAIKSVVAAVYILHVTVTGWTADRPPSAAVESLIAAASGEP